LKRRGRYFFNSCDRIPANGKGRARPTFCWTRRREDAAENAEKKKTGKREQKKERNGGTGEARNLVASPARSPKWGPVSEEAHLVATVNPCTVYHESKRISGQDCCDGDTLRLFMGLLNVGVAYEEAL
jgi:hypothetical protein